MIKVCSKAKLLVQVRGFVDDIHLLAYSKSTERNYRLLERAYSIYLEWARTYRAIFAHYKYELVHLSRAPKRFNIQELVRFSEAKVAPDTSIRILGLYIDSKLRWGPYIA